ncbi:MAG: DUF427 domain-containing protein [Bacteroidia bacterium]|nr:DUF427 domain-containing protein [Bacteroidia bacterium]
METSEKRHYAVIDAYNRKLTISYNNEVIAETTEALILKEVGTSVYNPVFYLPKESLKVELENEAERNSFCPIKGEASYWNFKDEPTDQYFAWSYEDPLPRSKKVKGYVAFNPAYVTITSAPIG